MLNVNILWFAEGLACNYYLRVQLLFYRENMHNLHLVNNIGTSYCWLLWAPSTAMVNKHLALRGLSGFQLAGQYLIGAVANVFKVATGNMDKANGIGIVISEFYESIQKGSEPPVSLDISLRVVKLMNQVWPK